MISLSFPSSSSSPTVNERPEVFQRTSSNANHQSLFAFVQLLLKLKLRLHDTRRVFNAETFRIDSSHQVFKLKEGELAGLR